DRTTPWVPASADTPAGTAPPTPTAPGGRAPRSAERGSGEAAPGLSLAGLAPREFCRAAARIGPQVADALASAAAEGGVHRDVKPSKLLVDDRGGVWVTDFGVAKSVEEAGLTQSGDLVGTLKYMPPERFSGQSDARGDVYSLGVTLYELLAL